MAANQDFGVVVIGAGDMGVRHARGWQMAGAKVVAVCDPDEARALAAALPLGALGLRIPDDVLGRDDVHAVSVCTPTVYHAPYTVQALEAGKHVLCEKPVSLTLDDAETMQRAAQTSGKTLRIGFMRHFDPAYRQLVAMHGGIGGPVLAQATIAAGVRPKLLMHDARVNGGPIIDMCCHLFNLWSTLFGAQPTVVSARGYTFSDGKAEVATIEHKALDSAQITLEYPGGTLGQVQVSWGLPAGIIPTESHTYMAPNGLISVDWSERLTLHDASGETTWQTDGADPWHAQIAYFYRELTEDAPQRVATIDDGIAALRTSLAVLESVRTQQPIDPATLQPRATTSPSADVPVISTTTTTPASTPASTAGHDGSAAPTPGSTTSKPDA
ncbi:MAG: Gfo/Idh/MocA family oxidoreductase [Trueperaceae bacterium]|nr:Gfo/Idh/MocA family oxidoreductase [Trueperaceae bacterium]